MIGILIVIIILLLIGKYFYKVSCVFCKCADKMIDRVVVITGSNTGIGFETAEELARRGAKVILACRDEKRANAARDKIIKTTGNQNIVYKHLDLASFKSVRAFADDILKTEPKLDVLINNAGTGNCGNFLTEDNLPFETQVNHFSPFLLTTTLLPLLKSSAPSRIINVSSIMHRIGRINLKSFDKQAKTVLTRLRVYSDTKLANILFTRKLSEVLSGTGVTVNCLHPGAVNTEIFRDKNFIIKFLIRIFFMTSYEGAQTTIHLAVSEELKDITGKYFCDCEEVEPSLYARDAEVAEKLWELSEEVCDRTNLANKPDIVLIDRLERRAVLADVTIPHDVNFVKAEKEKLSKYLDLANEVVSMWDVDSAIIVPIVVSAKSLDQHFKRLSLGS